jgi:polyisoprenoid-binding protein YceI
MYKILLKALSISPQTVRGLTAYQNHFKLTNMSNENKWSIDPTHSQIGFKIRHLMISNIKGIFKHFEASIYTTGNDFTTAQIDLWIDANSIQTGDEKRDEHLKSNGFFDTEDHKQITFTASTIGSTAPNGQHELWGELSIKGITKNIKLMVEFGGISKDQYGSEKAGFSIKGSLNRSDWDMVWNKALDSGGMLLSDEVHISCDIELLNTDQNNLIMELETEPS